MSETRESTLFMGPSWRLASRAILLNPFVWPALVLTLFSFSSSFQNLIYHLFAEKPGAMRSMLTSYYRYQREHHLGYVYASIVVGVIAWAIIRKATTRYTMEQDCLYVAEGVLHRYVNTVAKSLIYDCDISQDFFQVCFGTGDLVIRTVDHQVIRLRFVPDPEKWRDAIMSRSSVNDARMLGTI